MQEVMRFFTYPMEYMCQLSQRFQFCFAQDLMKRITELICRLQKMVWTHVILRVKKNTLPYFVLGRKKLELIVYNLHITLYDKRKMMLIKAIAYRQGCTILRQSSTTFRKKKFQKIIFWKSTRREKIYFRQNFRFIYHKTSSVQVFPTIIKNNKPNLRILNTNNK